MTPKLKTENDSPCERLHSFDDSILDLFEGLARRHVHARVVAVLVERRGRFVGSVIEA